jgi:hypothetical protein
VSTGGGIVSLSQGVHVKVAAGTAPGTTITERPVPDAPAYPGGLAAPAGPAVDIVPSGPVAAAMVQMSFNPATDLPRARPSAPAPTAGNAFIAVLDQATGTWVPLPTTYDPKAHQLVTRAPHFSTFRKYVLSPGKHLLHTAAGAVSVIVKAGESGLSASEDVAKTVWNTVRPEYGVGIRRQLSKEERIYDTCDGSDKQLPWDWNWPIYVNNADMQVRSCVVDADANPRTPALLMENDYGFPVDVFPLEKGAVLPEPEVTGNYDQDIVGALNRAQGIGYIPGPGVTQIQLPGGTPRFFSVAARASWLGLTTNIILSAAAIVPGFKAEMSRYTTELQTATKELEVDGRTVRSQVQVLRVTRTKLESEKGPLVEGAERIAAAYTCFAALASAVSSGSKVTAVAAKMAGCLKELLPKPGDAVATGKGLVSEYASYLDAIVGFYQLPAVLNDFREHGRQTFVIDAARRLTDGPYYGTIESVVNGSQLTVKFDHHDFVQAQTPGGNERLCKQNGIPVPPAGVFCHEYFEKDEHLTMEGPISPSVTLTYFQAPPGEPGDGSVGTYPMNMEQLAQVVTKDPGTLFKFTVHDGLITSIDAVYTP